MIKMCERFRVRVRVRVRVIKSLKSIQSGQTTRREYVPRRGGLTNWC